MKLKQYATIGIGVVAGAAISVIGVSYASQNTTSNANLITSEKAKSIMLNQVPEGNFIEFSYDGDDRIPKYDGKLIKDNFEYEVDVNARTGEVVLFVFAGFVPLSTLGVVFTLLFVLLFCVSVFC